MPAILVPYPFAAADHQTANARAVEATGAAVVVADADIAKRLPAIFAEATSPTRFAALGAAAARLRGNDATAAIVARIRALVSRKHGT